MRDLLRVTDQVRCYDHLGSEIPCRNSGQDASQKPLEKQVVSSGKRFQAKGDFVVDSLTGHIWTLNANPAEYPLSWQEAHDFIVDMNENGYSGFSNWHLPDRKTLFSLISHQHVNPSLPKGHLFESVFPGYYWTADTCARLPDQAWYIHLGGGRIFRGMKHGAYLTWPVIPKIRDAGLVGSRFSQEDALIHDHQNSVSWLLGHRCFMDCLTWCDTLESIDRINRDKLFGCTRWRLPNIRELESLVNIDTHSPAVFHPLRDSGIRPGYWSSTTSVYEPRYAWVLYPRDGEVGVGFKQNPEFFGLALTDSLHIP